MYPGVKSPELNSPEVNVPKLAVNNSVTTDDIPQQCGTYSEQTMGLVVFTGSSHTNLNSAGRSGDIF